jgi:hypothetical protein
MGGLWSMMPKLFFTFVITYIWAHTNICIGLLFTKREYGKNKFKKGNKGKGL